MRASKLRLAVLLSVAAGLASYAWSGPDEGARRAGGNTALTGERSTILTAGKPRGATPSTAITITRVRPATPAPHAYEKLNPLARLKRERLSETVSRPLFSPTRRPPPALKAVKTPVKAAPPPPPHAVNKLALIGIVMGGEKPVALLRHKQNGQSFRASLGEVVGGWKVASIGAGSVILARKARRVSLSLFKD